MIVLAVLVIIFTILAGAFISFQKRSDLNYNVEKVINTIRVAQNKTLASEGSARYGVYFDNISVPNKYTLFKGPDFASRDAFCDQVYNISEKVEIYNINLEGSSEIVFERLTGNSGVSGDFSLKLKKEPWEEAESQTIYIEESGQVSVFSPVSPSDGNRIKDSRHVHFDYARVVDINTENLVLDFGTKTENISIAENTDGSQIYWEGEIEVSGDLQKLKIHTHILNNPHTQFSVHRDRRYNNKPLSVSLSGDISGPLVEYLADGSAVSSTSIYVSNIDWQ